MPIEIKQLIIRAVVEPTRESSSTSSRRGKAEPVRRVPAPVPSPAELDRDAVIAECTRQVLRELRKGRER